MKTSPRPAILILAAALWTLGGPLRAERCGVCHPQERVAHESGVHAREEVGCVSCHGGAAQAFEVEAAHRGSFRSLRQRRAIPELCASCHADLEAMRAYNLPVDQYALYQTSAHGTAVASGEERAAVCTDCHGVHDIRSAEDPRSSVYPRHLPETCGRCHGDPQLMGALGLGATAVDEYLGSVHGKALHDEGNLAAPNCTSCHGVHGAAPPGFGDLDKVCGSCHGSARRAFLAGPHHQGMRAAELPECAACHSNHAIVRRASAEIVELCAECHEAGSPQAALSETFHTLIAAAGEEIREAEALVARAEEVPLHVEDQVARLEEARTYLTEARPLVHTVTLEPVEQMTRRARSIGEEVQHELYTELDHRGSRLGLAAFWFYLVMTLAILLNHKRRLGRGEARGARTGP